VESANINFFIQLNPSTPCSPNDGFTKYFAAKSVSINHKNGNVVTLVHSTLSVYDINGNLVASLSPDVDFEGSDLPSCAIATDCPEWMELGIVAISGHMNGHVRFWSIDYETDLLVLRHVLPENVHSCPITVLRISGEKQDTLLVGDKSGKMSACTTVKLDHFMEEIAP